MTRARKNSLGIAVSAAILLAGGLLAQAASADSTDVSSAVSTDAAVTVVESPSAVDQDTQGKDKKPKDKKPKAYSPEDLLDLLGEKIVAQDMDAILALHESEAVVVEWDGSLASGHSGIREMYEEWFASDPVLTVDPLQVVEGGGDRKGNKVRGRLATVMGTYSLEQTDVDGSRVTYTGNFCDVVRQQPDGSWLYVMDNPYPPHH